ncbi:iron-only hydrogenase system regulator [Candidatus Kapaibacterium sp.]
MEKRIGTALIIVDDKSEIEKLNKYIGFHSDIIISRQGLPLKDRTNNLISLIYEGTTDEIGALTGKIGRLKGIRIKSLVIKNSIAEEVS